MIYHVLNANVFHHVPGIIEHTLQYADKTNRNGTEEHFFILTTFTNCPYITKNNFSYEIYKQIFKKNNCVNYKFVNNNIDFLHSLFKISKQDMLILHDKFSLFGYLSFFWLFLFLRGKKYCKRVNIINWGVSDTLKIKSNIIHKILFKIKKHVLNNFKFVITLSSEDEVKIKNQYNLTNVITANYIADTYNEFKTKTKNDNTKNETIKIMISHSGFEQNNHIQTFKLLERFKNENIQIICPLSYGNSDYVKNVIAEGERIFKEKFIYFLDLLPRNDYINLLASIDIFIANTSVQTSLYVIHFGLCIGMKMYLSGNNYNSIKLLGFKTNHVKELDTISFVEFTSPIKKDWLENNDKKAKEIFSADERIKIWREIYDYNNQ